MKLYVAGNFNEKKYIRRIMDGFEKLGHEITQDWTKEKEFCGEVAYRDIEGVKKADVVIIYFINSHTYKGAYSELGGALTLNKPVVIVGDAGDGCIFTTHPLVIKMSREAQPKEIIESVNTENNGGF